MGASCCCALRIARKLFDEKNENSATHPVVCSPVLGWKIYASNGIRVWEK